MELSFLAGFPLRRPSSMAGNVCLLKHASNVPSTARAIEKDSSEDSGMPDHAFKTLLVETPRRPVSSSNESWWCGSHRERRGGPDPKSRLLPDGISKKLCWNWGKRSLPRSGRCGHPQDGAHGPSGEEQDVANSGQSCIAAKRFIVMAAIVRPFMEALERQSSMVSKSVTPWNRQPIGPLAEEGVRWRSFRGNWKTQTEGARVVYGPPPPSGKGFFFQPAIAAKWKKTCESWPKRFRAHPAGANCPE